MNFTGKLIVIEGTDCSGKETQTTLLVKKLLDNGIKCSRISFPMYDTPTGKIIGGPFLGKEYICEGWFSEKSINVDPMVSSLYYAADRKYNLPKILKMLNNGVNVIVDRYMYSNMAHQGGKLDDKEKRLEMYKWLETLEFEFLELPKADIKVFLHMPYEVGQILRSNRVEALDQNESSKEYMLLAESAYKEVSSLYNFKTIECNEGDKPRSIGSINNELYDYILNELDKKNN